MSSWSRLAAPLTLNQAGARTASTASTGSTPVALPTLGPDRLIRVHATHAAWINFGLGSGEAAAAATVAATSIPLVVGVEVMRVPVGATHFAVIRDAADGNVTIHAAG